MRLLNTETLHLELFDKEPFPEYAILSHRWGNDEMSFQEFNAGWAKDKNGYEKIVLFCAKAKQRGFNWCWVDTCGIDKTSSAELSEAINSMYKWYENSATCFAYLPHVTAQKQPDGSYCFQNFRSSCWFTRGWTLQEMIAPRSVEFYSLEWIYIGTKHAKAEELSIITAVDKCVLLGISPVRAASAANIMSWASRRVTTRREDIAYCLLGLFGIHMPLLYGEGDRAFIRLQEQILKQSSDQSLFAWNPLLGSGLHPTTSQDDLLCGIFSPSPACFAETGDVRLVPGYWDTESTLTNRGLRLRMPIKYDSSSKTFVGILCCISGTTLHDVGIEFHSISNSLEDLDHLIRRSTPVRYGNWSDDLQVQFKTVYLATETSLWHTRHFGQRFLRTELEFHVLLEDPQDLASLDGTPELYPPGVQIGESTITFKETAKVKRITVLNPLNTSYNSAAILLPTKFSQDIVLIFGFKSLHSGLPDVQHPWKAIVPIPKHKSLKEAWSEVIELPPGRTEEVMEVTVDGVQIYIKIAQQSWWARTSRNVLISLSRDKESTKSELEIEQWTETNQNRALDSRFPFIMGVTGAGKSTLVQAIRHHIIVNDIPDTKPFPVTIKRILGPISTSTDGEMEEVD